MLVPGRYLQVLTQYKFTSIKGTGGSKGYRAPSLCSTGIRASINTLDPWCGRQDLNLRHSRWQRDALPAELRTHCYW